MEPARCVARQDLPLFQDLRHDRNMLPTEVAKFNMELTSQFYSTQMSRVVSREE